MASKALAHRKAQNAAANRAKEIAELEASIAKYAVSDEVDDEELLNLHDDLTALLAEQSASQESEGETVEMTQFAETLDHAVEANLRNTTSYGKIAEEFQAHRPEAVSVLTGEFSKASTMNSNPLPVNKFGRGTDPIDTSKRIPVTGVGRDGQPLDRALTGKYDVVLMCPSHRNFNDTVLVNALLDRIQPEFIMHGGANGADAMARAWAISRGVEQREFLANWGDGPNSDNPGLGAAAGPIRNGEMLDLADELQEEHGKRVVIFTFTVLDQFGQDRITQSMCRMNAERNVIKNQDPESRNYQIPVFEAKDWLTTDFLASNPINKRGKSTDLPLPSSVR